ncbi:ATP-grasp domain-containing protein [Faecalibaculum rodentium]|jgi:biotin carboxylase|uniref:ATP-grasp domain-containing protein n=1 Tax=Faecalibaculum rodentium TaxID=1702221 RepID=UPI001C3CB6C1|nr:ATP-grasp domain-containing protein [Faecalibaculum rodentium]
MEKNLAIIGASYLQAPLIKRAKELGYTTHVFAWQSGDIGETLADFFYPISIREKDKILNVCKNIGILGICSIASDLATITVNYVAEHLDLVGNSKNSTILTTNKYYMRKAFFENKIPSPECLLIRENDSIPDCLTFPVIVKPTDRSGSRGITKVKTRAELDMAVKNAIDISFEHAALIEEFVEGDEYSVEYLSDQGNHQFLAITKKYTTGSPSYIEYGHIQPGIATDEKVAEIKNLIPRTLDALDIKYGASHTEIKIDKFGKIKLIEVGARMGGDFIGSDLVYLSTGVDFIGAVIKIAVGEHPILSGFDSQKIAAVRFIFNENDRDRLLLTSKMYPDILKKEYIEEGVLSPVTDSSNRHGFFILQSDDQERINQYFLDL